MCVHAMREREGENTDTLYKCIQSIAATFKQKWIENLIKAVT